MKDIDIDTIITLRLILEMYGVIFTGLFLFRIGQSDKF